MHLLKALRWNMLKKPAEPNISQMGEAIVHLSSIKKKKCQIKHQNTGHEPSSEYTLGKAGLGA